MSSFKPQHEPEAPFKPGAQFWAAFAGLCLSTLVSALDTSVFATALPTIQRQLQSNGNNIWVINIYFLTTAAFQPALGQVADIYGRRWPMIASSIVFLVGSGICGGAHNVATIVGGRAVQGIGNAGFNTLGEVIISDLVPLSQRPKFFGLFFAVMTVSAALGPFVGGVLSQHATWRWIFWLNFPVGGLGLALLLFFLPESRPGERTKAAFRHLARIDYVGNVLVIGATCAITIGLVFGSSGSGPHPWAEARVIVPLVVGLLTYAVFALWEMSPLAKEPVVPPRLFKGRTAVATYFITFIGTALLFWICYFYPFYFQSVLLSSPTRTGVQMLPWCLTFAAACAVGGGLLTRFGRYLPFHAFGFCLLTICFGLSSLLGAHSRTWAWVLLEMGLAIALGTVMATLLPALQVSLLESDVALGVSTWAYIRTLGSFWGTTVPAAVFEGRFARDLPSAITDPATRAIFSSGRAYQLAGRLSEQGITSQATIAEVVGLYAHSMSWTWYMGTLFAGICALAVLAEKNLKLPSDKKAADSDGSQGHAEDKVQE